MYSKFVGVTEDFNYAFITDNIKYNKKKFEHQLGTKAIKIALEPHESAGAFITTINFPEFNGLHFMSDNQFFFGISPSYKNPLIKDLWIYHNQAFHKKFDSIDLNKTNYSKVIKSHKFLLGYMKSNSHLRIVQKPEMKPLSSHRVTDIKLRDSAKIKDFEFLNKNRILVIYQLKDTMHYDCFLPTGESSSSYRQKASEYYSLAVARNFEIFAIVTKTRGTYKMAVNLTIFKLKSSGMFKLDSMDLNNFDFMDKGVLVAFDEIKEAGVPILSVFPQSGKKGREKELNVISAAVFDEKILILQTSKAGYRKWMENLVGDGNGMVVGIGNKRLVKVQYLVG